MSSNDVVDILQDRRGWVWMATNNGLNQFDAHETRIHRHDPDSKSSLSSNDLTCLALGEKGEIWVGTTGDGLNRFDPQTNESKQFLPGPGAHSNQLPSAKITDLAISEKHFLWIGTDKGLAVKNLLSGKIRRIKGDLGSSRISCISVFDGKAVWVGTAKGEVFQWEDKESEFRKVSSIHSPVTSIARDIQLQVWIGTSGSGLFRVTGESQFEKVFDEIRDVNTLEFDTNGDLWVGTPRGLAKMNRYEKSFQIYDTVKGDDKSLSHNFVTAVFEDRMRKLLWVATRGGGTSRFRLDRYWFPHIRYSRNENGLPHPSIWSMSQSSNGKVWIGTERGVARWDARNQSFERDLPGFDETGSPYAISLLEDSRENLWIGTKGDGLIRVSRDGLVTKFTADQDNPGSLGHNYISELFEDGQKRIWVGTHGGGIYLFRENENLFEKQTADSPGHLDFANRIRADHRGRIWAGTNEGLFVLEQGDNTWSSYSSVIPGYDDFPSQEISSIAFNKDYLWLGTENHGLARFHLISGEAFHYSTSNSDLPNDRIVSMAQDHSGFLWISTGSGLSRLDTINGALRNFTKEDGLLQEGYRPNAFAYGSLRNLLFGGNDGFNDIIPTKLPKIVQPPRPMLTQFEYFGDTVQPQRGSILEKPLSTTTLLKIPWHARNRFAFRFANLDYRFPNLGHFRYQMVGYDTSWNISGKHRRASYQSMPAGNYMFKVQSSLDGLKWPDNNLVASLAVRITAPWYQALWFRVLTVLGILALGFYLGRWILKIRPGGKQH